MVYQICSSKKFMNRIGNPGLAVEMQGLSGRRRRVHLLSNEVRVEFPHQAAVAAQSDRLVHSYAGLCLDTWGKF